MFTFKWFKIHSHINHNDLKKFSILGLNKNNNKFQTPKFQIIFKN